MTETNDITDTKEKDDSVSEPLISPVDCAGSPSAKVKRTGRLYQFSTRENGNGEMTFGNIFEIGYQRESDDLIVIRKRLWAEINKYEKDKENHNYEGQINTIINQAIDNIRNLYIWKLVPVKKEEVTYIQKIKLCNAKDLLETYEEQKNAKKPK